MSEIEKRKEATETLLKKTQQNILKYKAEIRKKEALDWDLLYYCLIGTLGVEKTKVFLKQYYELKEEIEQIENRRNE